MSISATDDLENRKRVWRVHIREAITEKWGAIIGDIIHNARAALDHIMVSIVKYCSPETQDFNHVFFIISDTEAKFLSALPGKTNGASPKAIEVLKRLRPYKNGNDILWILHKLDAIDKHRNILTLACAYENFGFRLNLAAILRDKKYLQGVEFPTIYIPPEDRSVHDGKILLECGLDQNLPKKSETPFNFQIEISEPNVIEKKSVIPLLIEICNAVEQVFSAVETEILRTSP
ncbi:MAG: hypothetical protein IT557_15725 [Alphaproteobacteria bacterium]|nr:hypothetical protein [Alphaproteobacteria bacterium]